MCIYTYIFTHIGTNIYIYLSLPLTTSPRQVSLITDVLNKKTLIWNPLDLKIKIENFLHLGNFYHWLRNTQIQPLEEDSMYLHSHYVFQGLKIWTEAPVFIKAFLMKLTLLWMDVTALGQHQSPCSAAVHLSFLDRTSNWRALANLESKVVTWLPRVCLVPTGTERPNLLGSDSSLERLT